MSYKITDGMQEPELIVWLKKAGQKFGTFNDGRVNYKEADIAPIVMCTVKYGNEILLVKRGYGLADAEGYWSTVNGFIDEIKPVVEQAQQEIEEELGMRVSESQITIGKTYTLKNPREKRRYIVFPCLISLDTKPKIILNEENTEYAWIKRSDLKLYNTLDDLPYAIDSALQV